MTITHNGVEYWSQVFFSIDRDGVSLEVGIGQDDVLEVFYSDVTHTMTLSLYIQDVSVEVIEAALVIARARLPRVE